MCQYHKKQRNTRLINFKVWSIYNIASCVVYKWYFFSIDSSSRRMHTLCIIGNISNGSLKFYARLCVWSMTILLNVRTPRSRYIYRKTLTFADSNGYVVKIELLNGLGHAYASVRFCNNKIKQHVVMGDFRFQYTFYTT